MSSFCIFSKMGFFLFKTFCGLAAGSSLLAVKLENVFEEKNVKEGEERYKS